MDTTTQLYRIVLIEHNHANRFTIFFSKESNDYVYESKLTSVRLQRADRYLPMQIMYKTYCCDVTDMSKMDDFVSRHLTKPYSYGQLIGLGIKIIVGKFGIKIIIQK